MSRGRSRSPQGRDTNMEVSLERKIDSKVVIVNNLTRNVVESHLKMIFSFYGDVVKIDLPLYGKSGQNRGKAALEFSETAAAQRALKHMNGGQLDGSTLSLELSDLPIRSSSRSPVRGGRGRGYRNGRDRLRSFSRSRSRSRSRSPPPPNYRRRGGPGGPYGRDRDRDSFRGRGGYRRRGPPPRGGRDDYYRPARSRSRSRSPIRRGAERPLPPRRRSPSYTRGGYGGRRRSRSYSVRSSRSRTRSYSRSRTRSRSLSYSSDSRYTKSRSRTRSVSRGRRTRSRSRSRDDIRDSRSRSPR